jgi:hypothetical protein
MIADAKHLLEFVEDDVRLPFDVGEELLRIEFTSVSPADFGVSVPFSATAR